MGAGTVKNSFYIASVKALCIIITGKYRMVTENFYIYEYMKRHLESTYPFRSVVYILKMSATSMLLKILVS